MYVCMYVCIAIIRTQSVFYVCIYYSNVYSVDDNYHHHDHDHDHHHYHHYYHYYYDHNNTSRMCVNGVYAV